MTRFLMCCVLALLAAPAHAEDPVRPQSLRTWTTEWISLPHDRPALWVEGDARDGTVTLEIRVASDTTVVTSRETRAREGHFSSLLRPERLPCARYTLEIRSGAEVLTIPLTHGTETQLAEYARQEELVFGDCYERIVSLTSELHRIRDSQVAAPDRPAWDRSSAAWRTRHASLLAELEDFRKSRGVLALARDFYRLKSSLLFAQTLHALYAAELGFAEGEPGEDNATEWSEALDEQLEGFMVGREIVPEADLARWIGELGDEEAEVRERATEGLSRAGERARSSLVEGSESGDEEIRARCLNLLRDLDSRR